MTCEAGGTCAFIGTGNTDKVVLHALGFVPRAADLLTQAPRATPVVAAAVAALLDAVRDGARSAAPRALPRANLKNALRVWSAVGGSMNWAAPLPLRRRLPWACADHAHRTWPASPTQTPVPHRHQPGPGQELLHPRRARSRPARTPASTPRSSTCSPRACWRTRPPSRAPGRSGWRDAKDPNDRILYKTALRPTSGIMEVTGNFTDSAVFKRAGMTPAGDRRSSTARSSWSSSTWARPRPSRTCSAAAPWSGCGACCAPRRDRAPGPGQLRRAGRRGSRTARRRTSWTARRARSCSACHDRDRGRGPEGQRDPGDVLSLRVPEPRSRAAPRRRADHRRPLLRRHLRAVHRPCLAGGPTRAAASARCAPATSSTWTPRRAASTCSIAARWLAGRGARARGPLDPQALRARPELAERIAWLRQRRRRTSRPPSA